MSKWIVSLITLCLVCLRAEAYQQRNIFAKKLSGHTAKTVSSLKTIREKITKSTNDHLRALPESDKEALRNAADKALKESWHPALVYDYLEYVRDGNRNHFEGFVNKERHHLNKLVVGQLLAHQHNHTDDRYLAQIVNGLWIVLEMSTWVWPAHIYLQGGDHLPHPGQHVIDLQSGETMKEVGWIKMLFEEHFQKISPVINHRIDYELHKRVFEPFLDANASDHWFWTGFRGHNVNNWNIWINGNILKAALYTLNDEKMFNLVVNRTVHSADFFVNGYGDDGGCDEGPAYWRQAGGRLIEYLETLDHIYGVGAYFKQIPLLKHIGEYPIRMRIFDNWYVNFADSVPIINYLPSLFWKYGQLFNEDIMKQYASYVHKLNNQTVVEMTGDLNEFFNYISVQADLAKTPAKAPSSDIWYFRDIQVATLRSKPEFKDQLFVGAKAGNNHESHNHNDVGNFVLFVGHQPILIDIGVGTYTASTFGAHRFDLFYMQSLYHNCPQINGVAQKQGGNYTSRNTQFNTTVDVATLSSDISGAYPADASVKSWNRKITFDRANNYVQLEDDYVLTEFKAPQQLHFITVKETKVTETEHGLMLTAGTAQVEMKFDTKVFVHTVETRSLEGDHHLTHIWGESIQRLTLKTVDTYKVTKASFTVKFAPSQHELYYSY